MLKIVVPETELWDEIKNEFVTVKSCELQLEHSLVSISKWESKWNRAFLSKVPKTREQTLDYIQCMTITQNVSSKVFACLTNENIAKITEYINAPMTAVHFIEDENQVGSNRSMASEIIYSWMINLNIPFECQKWHINRLLTLIRVCNTQNKPKQKRSSRDIMQRNAALNAARRKKHNTKG